MHPHSDELEAVRRQFYAHGKTVTEWASEHGFDRHLVYSVLSGRSRAQRGESHRIAVALGLKKVADSELFSEPVSSAGAPRVVGTAAKEVPMQK